MKFATFLKEQREIKSILNPLLRSRLVKDYNIGQYGQVFINVKAPRLSSLSKKKLQSVRDKAEEILRKGQSDRVYIVSTSGFDDETLELDGDKLDISKA